MDSVTRIRMAGLIRALTHNPVWIQAKHSHNAGLMLDHRRRRWPNIKPALGQRLVFAYVAFICTGHE